MNIDWKRGVAECPTCGQEHRIVEGWGSSVRLEPCSEVITVTIEKRP